MKSKKIMAALCALAVVVSSSGGLPFGSLRLFDTAVTASAYDNNPYESLVNTTTVVKFNNIEWYLIADNSTAIDSGTVTLFTKNCVGSSKYNNSQGDGNSYSGSVIESAVNTYYSENFTDVSSAVVDDKLFLLTETEANSLITNIRCCPLYDSSQWRWRYSAWAWWTCSPGQRYSYDARCIIVKDTTYYTTENLDVRNINGIRPALKLDLSKVVFDETEKIFTLKQSTVAVTDITLSETTKTVHEGESFALTATVSPDDATDKTVTWSSSDTSVATVDENGKVTAVSEGTATITATATNGTDDTTDDKTATCAVTVDKAQTDPVYTITIPAEVDLKSTAPVNITAEDVTLGEGQKIIVTLDSASNTDSGSEFSAKTENGKSEVKYKINDGAIGLDDSNKTVAEFTGNGERELNFAVTDESGIKYAGSHTETLTFNIAVEDAPPSVKTITIEGYTITYNDNDTWAQIAATNDIVTRTDENIVKIDGRILVDDNDVVRHNHTINPGVSYYLGF